MVIIRVTILVLRIILVVLGRIVVPNLGAWVLNHVILIIRVILLLIIIVRRLLAAVVCIGLGVVVGNVTLTIAQSQCDFGQLPNGQLVKHQYIIPRIAPNFLFTLQLNSILGVVGGGVTDFVQMQ